MEQAFWVFIDKKWKDSLNVAAAEPAGWEQGADHRKGVEYMKKGELDKQAGKKDPSVGVHVTTFKGILAGPRRGVCFRRW